MAHASQSHRHWYVFATVGLAFLAIPGGWLLVKWREVRMQREAVAEIRKADASLE